MQDTFLNGEVFYPLKETQMVIKRWRKEYNTVRSHAALDYNPGAGGQ